jgi:aspartate/tyrosine/aromatic aminotransferase
MYRYYDKSNNTLDIGGFIEDVLSMPHGSLIVLLFLAKRAPLFL